MMTKEYADKFDKLVKQIIREAEEDGEPVTREEAEEMAKMELGAKEIQNYTQATVKKERKKTERKVDKDKVDLLDLIHTALKDNAEIGEIKPETEINFNYGENAYTVKLIKHRPPKK